MKLTVEIEVGDAWTYEQVRNHLRVVALSIASSAPDSELIVRGASGLLTAVHLSAKVGTWGIDMPDSRPRRLKGD